MSRIFCLFLLLVATSAIFAHQVSANRDKKDDGDYFNDEDEDYGDEDEEEETYTGPPASILSKPRDLSVKPGETARLPCEVENPADVVVIWKKGTEMLFTGAVRVTKDRRISMDQDNTLVIAKVNTSDAAAYTCSLGTPEQPSINHNLRVLLTPRIVKLLPGPTKTLSKGDSLTLQCEAVGYPQPTVSWSRKNKKFADGEEVKQGTSITFDSVTRKHAGVYECLASNNIGDPAVQSVDVMIQYPPEIEIEKEIVNSGEGYDAELVCEVHSEPKAKVTWLKDSNPIPARGTDRISITQSGTRRILEIKNTQKTDFGSYTCHAENSIGRIDRVIKLSGEPSPARFSNGLPMESGQTLEWKVESHSPITKYELRYRNKKSPDWTTVHPVVENPEGNVYTVKHTLKDLADGEYEVIVLSHNTYGWSEYSIPHIFKLNTKDETSVATNLKSPLVALISILSLSAFFL